MDQAGDVLAGPLPRPQPHVQGVQGQVGAQAGGHLPADDHAGEHVEDERGVDPAGVRADVGQVGDPELVRRRRDELAARPGRPGRSVSAPSPIVVLRVFSRRMPAQALGPHQPLDRAAGHLDALAVELGVDLPGAVDAEVVLVDDLADPRHQLARRAPPAPTAAGSWRRSRCSGRSATPASCSTVADRLDPEPSRPRRLVAMRVDVGHDHFSVAVELRRAKKPTRSSGSRSPAAAHGSPAPAPRAAAHRSCVVPGRRPSSISACRTQLRSVSGCIPNCSATRWIAPALVAGSCRSSTAIRVARSRSSSRILPRCRHDSHPSWIESLHQTRGDSKCTAQ